MMRFDMVREMGPAVAAIIFPVLTVIVPESSVTNATPLVPVRLVPMVILAPDPGNACSLKMPVALDAGKVPAAANTTLSDVLTSASPLLFKVRFNGLAPDVPNDSELPAEPTPRLPAFKTTVGLSIVTTVARSAWLMPAVPPDVSETVPAVVKVAPDANAMDPVLVRSNRPAPVNAEALLNRVGLVLLIYTLEAPPVVLAFSDKVLARFPKLAMPSFFADSPMEPVAAATTIEGLTTVVLVELCLMEPAPALERLTEVEPCTIAPSNKSAVEEAETSRFTLLALIAGEEPVVDRTPVVPA
jgi:hypothetical protein